MNGARDTDERLWHPCLRINRVGPSANLTLKDTEEAARALGLRATQQCGPRVPIDLASPYLLSGLGRCALCGGALIAMSRHHGRRRGFFYGCAYNSKRGPTVCRNHLHMPQEALERAVLDAVATAFDPAVLEAAIDRAIELMEERREASRQRRTAVEDALQTIHAPRKAD